MKVRTKGNGSPNGKPRIFFSCHPDDRKKCFDRICQEIFKFFEAAVYYIDDSDDQDENLESDLRQMSIFVIPVSLKFLSDDSFASSFALPFAKKEHIPILPIMLESGIEEIYSTEDKFGTLQYLMLDPNDDTAIGFEKKLKDYLDSILVGKELAERVRKAFDAYVFLSYRKKDRAFANEIMRLIHKDPLCRDIAIWYDEYLAPGEAFDESINKALDKSSLFTLLVTPNLVNEPNYVQQKEYPRAREIDLKVLPIEVVKTDRTLLEQLYPEIPECVSPQQEENLKNRLLENLGRIARTENDNDHEHNYLIGLAYLEGIDVEVDRSRAVSLIESAAEGGLPEAMLRLSRMYYDGYGLPRDYRLYLEWMKKAEDIFERTLSEDDQQLTDYRIELAFAYESLGYYDEALELLMKARKAYEEVLQRNDSEMFRISCSIANIFYKQGDYEGAYRMYGINYKYRTMHWRKDDAFSLTILSDMAACCVKFKDYEKALQLYSEVYEGRKKELGENHPDTLKSLLDMADCCSSLGDHKSALAVYRNVYYELIKYYKNDHPRVIHAMNNMAILMEKIGDIEGALALHKVVLETRLKLYGESHPDTLVSMYNIANIYKDKGRFQEALELHKKVYDERVRILKDYHPLSRKSSQALFDMYVLVSDYENALKVAEAQYDVCRRVFGEDDETTRKVLKNIDIIKNSN
ncbi:MAG: tetratricopeptide repeat protein [Butyrivibrio sp.]|nr:tetratricopeptide repeat protein [Butyrivibrio sp.]